MRSLYSLLFCWCIAGPSYASIPNEISAQELYAESADVAYVLIEKAEMINVGAVRCGARYDAKIIEGFKTSKERIVFEASNGFEIGGEYLFFFKPHDPPSHLNSSPAQLASCPAHTTEITPDYSRGIIKVELAPNAEFVFEVFGAYIKTPESIESSPPHRYKSDEWHGTVWLNREALLKYLRSLKESSKGGT